MGGGAGPQLRGGNQAPRLILLLLCIQRVSAELLAGTFVMFFDELCFIFQDINSRVLTDGVNMEL